MATVAGVVVGCFAPDVQHLTTRLLLGWNVGVWLFLLLVGAMMLQADHERVRRNAIAQAEGAAVVLALVIIAAILSIVAILVQLGAAKGPDAHHAAGHIAFAFATVGGSWLLLPTLFAMNYASLYYDNNETGGLEFPSNEKTFRPDYSDFFYFSFTIAVASQTADVSISDRPMRRLVLLQSVLSFLFNTTILAFTINIAAGLSG